MNCGSHCGGFSYVGTYDKCFNQLLMGEYAYLSGGGNNMNILKSEL